MHVELEAMKAGLHCLTIDGHSRTIIETNFSEVVSFIHANSQDFNSHRQLVLECQRLHNMLWSSPIVFVFRTCNIHVHLMVHLHATDCINQGLKLLYKIPPIVREAVDNYNIT